ncbi:hypothetical protein [Streptomyces albus]|uniref:hypothetical protein n=1 Tax=Streptomyces albus TaxID=1888 RepID=UPI0004CB4996|nr:hypothetical protein [Streptomyces albus]
MITTDPTGDWSWDITPVSGAARPRPTVEIAGAIRDVLADHDLSSSPERADFTVRPLSEMRDVRVDGRNVVLEADPLKPGTALSAAVAQAESLDGEFLVSLRARCPGFWWEAGVRHRAEQLFAIQVQMWGADLIDVTLETYSDAWLTQDTRGREQAAVHADNAPRLAAALKEISTLLGTVPVPGDPNRYTTPTETGFEDPRTDGPAFDDPWGTFEGAARSRRLRSMIAPSEDEYEDITDHPVRYFAVRGSGQVLGYVWASFGDNAAGYTPRTPAGDAAFEAGGQWLLRLREAHGEGLTALNALDWVAEHPPLPEWGSIAETEPAEAPSLDALEELSGRY